MGKEKKISFPEEPEDIGAKFSTTEGAEWVKIKKNCEQEVLNCKRTIEMDEVLLIYAEKRIAEENKKFKR